MVKYITKQREILQNFLNGHAHELLSADQIASELDKHKISISAVYRNLAELEKEDKIRRFTQYGTRKVLYQYIASDSCINKLHLSCKNCGKTFHVENSVTSYLDDFFKTKTDFQIIPADTIIYGICAKCEKTGVSP